MSEKVQYTIVAVILLGAIVWIVVNTVRKRKKKGSSCCGCSLADVCSKTSEKEHGDCRDKDCCDKKGVGDK